MRPRMIRRQTNLLLLATLLIIFSLATIAQPRALSADEAWWLWVVRDDMTVKFTSVGETARIVIDNFRTTIERAQQASTWDLPYAVMLDGWTMLVGDFHEMGRIFSAFLVMLALAILWRVVRWGVFLFIVIAFFAAQSVGLLSVVLLLVALGIAVTAWRLRRSSRGLQRVIAGFAVIVLLFWHLVLLIGFMSLPLDPWDATIQQYIETRNPLEPVLTNYPPDSIAGYYDYRYNLRRGVSIDLSWKSFTTDEIGTIIRRLTQGGYPIWLVMLDDAMLSVDERAKANSPELMAAFQRTDEIAEALEQQGWERNFILQVGMMMFYRFERVTISADDNP